jgi:phosphoribosylaminoimidazole-succinocarboxamide synthase
MTTENFKMYEGKAKVLYSTGVPDELLMVFKDDITAGDGAKKDTMTNKGRLNCTISKKIFEYLHEYKVNTHYLSSPETNEQFVKQVKIIPVEVVIRNISAGSICRRYNLEKGIIFSQPLLELFFKNDDLHDPLANEDVISELKWATRDQLRQMKEQAHIVHKLMTVFWAEYDLTLVDAKYEFGVTSSSGEIVLADEITCDSQRIWTKDCKSLDKDVFRQGDNMGDVEDVYNYIHKLIGADSIEGVK